MMLLLYNPDTRWMDFAMKLLPQNRNLLEPMTEKKIFKKYLRLLLSLW